MSGARNKHSWILNTSCILHSKSNMRANFNQYTDEQLISFLQGDEHRALTELYNRYWKRLFLVAANILDSAEIAEECVQNVFVSLWNRRKKLELSHSVHTYLSVAVKYQSLTALTRNKRRKEKISDEKWYDTLHSDSPESEFIVKELTKRIEASINKLPPQCQLIFRMSREEGKSMNFISQELNLSLNTVKMHLKIANKKLRDDLLVFLPFILILFSGK